MIPIWVRIVIAHSLIIIVSFNIIPDMKNISLKTLLLISVGVAAVAFLCMSLIKKNDLQFETDRYRVTLTPITKHEAEAALASYDGALSTDSVVDYGTIRDLAYAVIQMHHTVDSSFDMFMGPTLFLKPQKRMIDQYYKMVIIDKLKDSIPDFLQVLRGMESQHLVSCDTSYQNMQLLRIKDADKLSRMTDTNSNAQFTMRAVVYMLRTYYSMPVMLDEDINPSYPIYIFRGDWCEDSIQFISYLEDSYGLTVEKKRYNKMQVINIH